MLDTKTADCFVDATDELDEPELSKRLEEEQDEAAEQAEKHDNHQQQQQQHKHKQEQRAPLRVRLDETTHILRLALSNEFVRALELCEQR